MTTYLRICLKNYTIVDGEGKMFTLKRKKEYLTSDTDENGQVTVFSQYWVKVPANLFDGGIQYT